MQVPIQTPLPSPPPPSPPTSSFPIPEPTRFCPTCGQSRPQNHPSPRRPPSPNISYACRTLARKISHSSLTLIRRVRSPFRSQEAVQRSDTGSSRMALLTGSLSDEKRVLESESGSSTPTHENGHPLLPHAAFYNFPEFENGHEYDYEFERRDLSRVTEESTQLESGSTASGTSSSTTIRPEGVATPLLL